MENQIAPIKFPQKNSNSKFSDISASHVGISTTKFNELIEWYKQNLDFRVIKKWEVNEIQLAFIAPPGSDDFIVEVICYNNNEQADTAPVKQGYNHLAFHVKSLDETINELTKRDIKIERSFSVPAISLRCAFITDPFGNSIEFSEDMK